MQPGDTVEDFELPDENGEPRKLSEFLAQGPAVVFFYPAALTPACTKQSCHFRDTASEFNALGAQRVGISGDDIATQKKFSDKHKFDYPLLSDADGRVSKMLGVTNSLNVLQAKRKTFVIDTDFKVLAVVSPSFSMNAHADKALDALKAR